jgi:hypothetical protein
MAKLVILIVTYDQPNGNIRELSSVKFFVDYLKNVIFKKLNILLNFFHKIKNFFTKF